MQLRGVHVYIYLGTLAITSKSSCDSWRLPLLELHSTIVNEVLLHLERIGKDMGLVEGTDLGAVGLSQVDVLVELVLEVGVGAVVNEDTAALTRSQTTEVSQTLLGNNDVQVVLGLVDVSGEGNNAGDTGGVSLGLAHGGGVHDRKLGVTEEIGATTKTVQHTATVDTSRVGVTVDVDLDGGVHGDASETTDKLGVVGDLLVTEEDLLLELVELAEETLETGGGQANRGGSGEVQAAVLKEVEEGVLEHLAPHIELTETRLGKTLDNGVGDVANTALKGVQVLRETTLVDLVAEEVDEVASNVLAHSIRGSVVGHSVLLVGLDNGQDLAGVDLDTAGAEPLSDVGSGVRLGVRRKQGLVDIVDTLEAGEGSVQLNDNLVGIGNHLGGATDGGTQDKVTLLVDTGGLDQGNVNALGARAGGAVLGVVTVHEVLRSHGQMLIEEKHVTTVDSGRNVLTNLVGGTTLDHSKVSPAGLDGQVGGGTSEQIETNVGDSVLAQALFLDHISELGGNELGTTNTGESGPAEVHIILEVGEDFLDRADLVQERLVADTRRKDGAHSLTIVEREAIVRKS